MKRHKSSLLLILLPILLIPASLMFRSSVEQNPAYKEPSGCEDEVLHESHSPDGSVKATLIERGCGATTNQVFLVYLSKGNTIYESGEVFETEKATKLTLIWVSKDELKIVNDGVPLSYADFWLADRWNGFSVRFAERQ